MMRLLVSSEKRRIEDYDAWGILLSARLRLVSAWFRAGDMRAQCTLQISPTSDSMMKGFPQLPYIHTNPLD
jgi:hypothetical protein